jgi:hypothetical protein
MHEVKDESEAIVGKLASFFEKNSYFRSPTLSVKGQLKKINSEQEPSFRDIRRTTWCLVIKAVKKKPMW